MHELAKYLLKNAAYVVLFFAPVIFLFIGVRFFVPRENYSLAFVLIIVFCVLAVILIYDRATHRSVSYSEQAEALD
jgi:hypothetical protein